MKIDPSVSSPKFIAGVMVGRRLQEENFGIKFQTQNEQQQNTILLDDRYERLVSRRSIRFVLRLAGITRPIFGFARRIRSILSRVKKNNE